MMRPTEVEHIVAPPRGESPAGAASSFLTCHPARVAVAAFGCSEKDAIVALSAEGNWNFIARVKFTSAHPKKLNRTYVTQKRT